MKDGLGRTLSDCSLVTLRRASSSVRHVGASEAAGTCPESESPAAAATNCQCVALLAFAQRRPRRASISSRQRWVWLRVAEAPPGQHQGRYRATKRTPREELKWVQAQIERERAAELPRLTPREQQQVAEWRRAKTKREDRAVEKAAQEILETAALPDKPPTFRWVWAKSKHGRGFSQQWMPMDQWQQERGNKFKVVSKVAKLTTSFGVGAGTGANVFGAGVAGVARQTEGQPMVPSHDPITEGVEQQGKPSDGRKQAQSQPQQVDQLRPEPETMPELHVADEIISAALEFAIASACEHVVAAGVPPIAPTPIAPTQIVPTPPPKSSHSNASGSTNGNETSGQRSARPGPGTRQRTSLMRGQTSYLSDALMVPGQRATAYGPSATVAAIAPSTHGLWPATEAVAEANTGHLRVKFSVGEKASVEASGPCSPSARKKQAGQFGIT